MTKARQVMKRATRRVLEQMSSIYKILQETFLGMRHSSRYSRWSLTSKALNAMTRDYCNRSMRSSRPSMHLSGPIIEVFGVVSVCAALLAGAYLVLNHQTHLVWACKCVLTHWSRSR